MVYIWAIAALCMLLYAVSYAVSFVAMLLASAVHFLDVLRPPRIVRTPKKSRLP